MQLSKILYILVVFFLFFLSMGVKIVYADEGIVDFVLEPNSGDYQQGDIITLYIKVKSENTSINLSSVGIRVVYDSTRLELNSYTTEDNIGLTWQNAVQEDESSTQKAFIINGVVSDVNTPFGIDQNGTQLITLKFNVINSGDAIVYFKYSDDRNNFDNMTSAIEDGGATDISDHDFYNVNSPVVFTLTGSSSTTQEDSENNQLPDTGVNKYIFRIGVGVLLIKLSTILKYSKLEKLHNAIYTKD